MKFSKYENDQTLIDNLNKNMAKQCYNVENSIMIVYVITSIIDYTHDKISVKLDRNNMPTAKQQNSNMY